MVIPLICFIYRRVYGGVSTVTKKDFAMLEKNIPFYGFAV